KTSFSSELIKRLQNTALSQIFPMPGYFLAFEAGEGHRRIIRIHDLSGVEDITQLIPAQAIQTSVIGVQFALQLVAAIGVPAKRRAIVAKVTGERSEVVTGVGQLQHTGGYVI